MRTARSVPMLSGVDARTGGIQFHCEHKCFSASIASDCVRRIHQTIMCSEFFPYLSIRQHERNLCIAAHEVLEDVTLQAWRMSHAPMKVFEEVQRRCIGSI